MPCWEVRMITVSLENAKDLDAMYAAYASVLGITVEQFKLRYLRGAKTVRFDQYSPLARVETQNRIKKAYAQNVVRKAAKRKGYRIRAVNENKWELYR